MYDVLIVGGGPGGYWAAKKAGQSGLKSVLFEKNSLGGVCVREGCIPSKTYIHAAKMYDYSRHNKYFNCDSMFDLKKMKQKKKVTVARLTKGIEQDVTASGVEIITAQAVVEKIENSQCIVTANDKTYVGKNLIIATGSDVIVPPVEGIMEGIKDKTVITHKELFELEQIPQHVAIIGGGVIGLEFAMLLKNLGVSVVIIEQANRLALAMDEDMSLALREMLEKKGIEVYTNTTVMKINGETISYNKETENGMLQADKIILTTGRKPDCGGIDYVSLGIDMMGSAIKANDQCRTNYDNVYAIGDINGKSMLAHSAYKEAEVCVSAILGKDDVVDYNLIPSVIYTTPEIAAVGLTEQQARSMGLECSVKTLPLSFSGRYLAENDLGTDFCKLILDTNEKIIGFHMLGPYASEIVSQMTIAMHNNMTVHDLQKIVFPHPTVAEIVHELVHKI